jgi:predicted ATPase
MLTELQLRDFKSFEDQTIPLHPLTLLVGANASGKSNLLDAILFLQGMSRDLPLTDVLRGRSEGGRQVWPGIRGGSSEVVRKGAADMSLKSQWRNDAEVLTHTITCVAGEHPLVVGESVHSNVISPYLFDTSAGALGAKAGLDGSNIRVAVKRHGKGNSVVQVHAATRSVLGQLSAGPGVAKAALERRDWLVAQMRAAFFLDITPARMRDYTPKGADFVGLSGERVSAVAWTICQDPEAKADLVDWLSELCASELVDIDFSTTDLGDVMIVLVEKGGRRIPARSLSDGTLRFLGELIALRTAPPGSMLLMEEIENGLHPTRAHLLVEAMEAATQERGIQVIATTHSPLVLNALSSTALHQTILVARSPDTSASIARPLGDLPEFDAVVERRGIDRLLSSGWLERAL